MENDFPAIVKAAVRDDEAVLAATEYATVPLPVPLDPELMVAQDTPVAAVQEQPLVAVTEMDPVPPLLVKEALDGEML